MFTVRDIQERYGVTEHTVLGWIKAGELKAVNVGRQPGKLKPRWRVSQSALEQFELQRTATPAMPTPRKQRKRREPEVIQFYK
jgi:transposase